MNACLEQANKRNHNSIAFPALGTGYHKFPADVAAGSIVAAINRFSGQQNQQNIKDIHVVLYGGSNELSTLEKVEFVLITIISMGTYKCIRVSLYQLKLQCQVKAIIKINTYTDEIVGVFLKMNILYMYVCKCQNGAYIMIIYVTFTGI